MNPLSSRAKKKFKQFLSVALTLTTTLVLSGLTMLVPVANAALLEGSLIKTANAPEVYIINDKAHGSYLGWKRHIFNPEVFNMYGHLKWSDIQIVSQSVVDSYQTSDLYKADVDPRVYSLEEMGTSAVKHHIQDVAAFDANGYSWDQVFTVNEKEVNYYATGSVITAGTTTTPPVTGTEVSVSLAADNPVSGTVIKDQAIADLAHFTFTNPTAGPVKITKLVFNRLGISADTSVANVYLFNGVDRVTDAATVSSGKINFVNTSGIVTVPANSSVTLAVRANMSATAGETIGVALATVEADATVTGTLPISGNLHSTATATLAGVNFNNTTTPSANTALDPKDDIVIWQNTVSITTRSAYLHSMRFRMIGSTLVSDVQNFELYVDGIKAGNTIAQADANGYLTFDLSAAPVEMKTGNRIVKVVADVVGGSSRNFYLSLRETSDVNVTDKDYGSNILVQANTTTFSARSAGQQTITSGTLTITKATDSPSGNVTLDATGVTLGKFTLKAAGEAMKVENLYVSVYNQAAGGTPVASSTMTIRNGALFANGVQVGSTASLASDTTGTQFSFGSALVVQPGSPVTLEVRGDVYDDSGVNGLASGATLQARVIAGSSNVQRQVSLGYISSSASNGNTLTISAGTMSLAKYSAYANQTAVVPQTVYKIGDFRLTADETENINLNTITLSLASCTTCVSATSTEITNLYVTYGPHTSSVSASGANSISWSISDVLPKNTTWNVEVYADLASSISSNEDIVTAVTFSGTTAGSGQTVTGGSTTGQTITAGAGTFAVAADASKPVEALLVAGSTVKVGSFKFSSVNETYTLDQLGASVTSGAQAAIQNVIFKDHTTGDTIATQPFNGFYATTSTGLGFAVPANMDKVVDAYVQLGTVGVGAATTSLDVNVTLNSYKVVNSTGSTTTAYPGTSGNSQYVVKSKPTVDMVAVTENLGAGAGKVLSKVKVSADLAGDISWKKLVFTVSKTTGITIGATSTLALVDSNGTTVTGTFATTTGSLLGGLDALGVATSGTISFVATSEQQIPAGGSKTYSLKGTIGGLATGYNYLSISVAAPSTSIATPDTYSVVGGAAGEQTPSFVWSDRSASSHSASTADWLNDYKVKELPTDSTTLDVTI
jgi:hypothetical protein